MNRRVTIVACALLAGMTLVSGCDRIDAWLHPNQCVLSRRPLRPGMRVQIEVESGPSGYACCARCAISYARQTGKRVRILSVTDYLSHDQLNPSEALYVVGSRVTPCAGPPVDVPAGRREIPRQSWDRCLPTVIALANQEDAERFQQEAGGTILTFAELVKGTSVTAPE